MGGVWGIGNAVGRGTRGGRWFLPPSFPYELRMFHSLLRKWRGVDLATERAVLAQQRPIVLMGRGHSGTRVLSHACIRMGVALGTTEDRATGDVIDRGFTELIKRIALRSIAGTASDEIAEASLQTFQVAAFQYYSRVGKHERSWGWKFPETYLITPYVARTFPAARYIHLIRDGRDIAFKEHLTDDEKRPLGKGLLSKIQALGPPRHLQAALSWAFQVDNFDQFRQSVDPDQVYDIRFEDLCLSPHETIEGLSDFLHMSLTQRCREYLHTCVDPDKVGQYKLREPHLIREVESRIEDTLRRYGYIE